MPRNPAPPPSPSRGLPLLLVAGLALAACGGTGPQLTLPAGATTSSRAAEDRVAAPSLRLTLFDGSGFDLGAHLSRDGRPVLLHLWASWCEACREEMPAVDDAARRHPEVLFLGVAVQDDPAAAGVAARDMNVAYPTGADLEGVVQAAFPAPQLPATYLIAADGTLLGAVYGGLGPRGLENLVTRYLER